MLYTLLPVPDLALISIFICSLSLSFKAQLKGHLLYEVLPGPQPAKVSEAFNVLSTRSLFLW